MKSSGLAAFVVLLLPAYSHAQLAVYDFSVDYSGTVATGSFSHRCDIIPEGGGNVRDADLDLLESFSLTWNSTAFDETTMKSGSMNFNDESALTAISIGTNCVVVPGVISSCQVNPQFPAAGVPFDMFLAADGVFSFGSGAVALNGSWTYSETQGCLDTPPPGPVEFLQGETATGSGIATATATLSEDSGSECAITESAFVAAPVAPPAGVDLPHGLLGFTASNCNDDFSISVTVEYPDLIPSGARYWKYSGEDWYTIPSTIDGNQVTFTITDNGPGDSNPALGAITDPGGIGIPGDTPVEPAAIPTLSHWGLMLMAAAMALLALARQRRSLLG